MASGWSSHFCSRFLFALLLTLLAVAGNNYDLVVHEGEPFNFSCTYQLPRIWIMTPQLVDTVGEGHCTQASLTVSFTCFVHSAKPENSGTYTIQIIQDSSLVTICTVDITVRTEEFSSTSLMSHVSSSSFLSSSSFSSFTTLKTSTHTPIATLVSPSTSSSVIVVSSTPTDSQVTSIVVIIVPAIAVGLLISVSLIIFSIVLLFFMRLKRKQVQNHEESDTGFFIGNKQTNLYNEDCNDEESNEERKPFTSILFQELISKGRFSLVHHASINQKEVSVKQLKDKRGREELMHEISLLKELNDKGHLHRNIVSFIGVTEPPDPLCLIIEHLPHGTLKDLLISLQKGPVPTWYFEHTLYNSPRGVYNNKQISDDLFNILMQVAKGAEHLANEGLVHGHLATENVLLGRNLIAKLGNFTITQSGDYFVKTERESYLLDFAPEVISDGDHTMKSDVWSFGILIYKVATFETHEPWPVSKIKPTLLHYQLMQGTRPSPLPCFSKELYYQMQQCWKINKDERPDFTQIYHTLEVLSQSSWAHLLFEISGKRKSYIDENHQIYLFPPPTQPPASKKKILLSNGKRIISHASSPELIVNTSGFNSDASSESVDRKSSEEAGRGRGGLWWAKRKNSTAKPSTSQLAVSQRKASSIEEFERNLLTSGAEIKRTNPLAM